jgi:hypothetical protein
MKKIIYALNGNQIFYKSVENFHTKYIDTDLKNQCFNMRDISKHAEKTFHGDDNKIQIILEHRDISWIQYHGLKFF